MAMNTFPEDDLRHPEEWEKIEGIRIVNADGWLNTSTPWDLPISYAEFLELSNASTIELRQEYTQSQNMLRLRAQTNTLSGLLHQQ